MARRAPPRRTKPPARRLLAGRGWVDRDQDGVRENRSGAPLALDLQVTSSSQQRQQMALMIQEQLREVGVKLEVIRLEPAVWSERRAAGDFDIDFSAATQDPSPSGLTSAGPATVPATRATTAIRGVDSLLFRAMASPTADRGAVAPVPPPDRGGRTRGVHLRSDLHLRGEPALSRREHPAGSPPGGSLWRWPAPALLT